MKDISLLTLLRLRLAVGLLGESSRHGWWSCAFFDPASRAFLEPVFARTLRGVQHHGVREAACPVHDELIGLGDAFHLFRLPEEVEEDLHALMLAESSAPELTEILTSSDAALAFLDATSEGQPSDMEGPHAIGPITDLRSPQTLRTLAAAYLGAFRRSARAYPYLTP